MRSRSRAFAVVRAAMRLKILIRHLHDSGVTAPLISGEIDEENPLPAIAIISKAGLAASVPPSLHECAISTPHSVLIIKQAQIEANKGWSVWGDLQALKEIVLENYLNLLLLLIPIAIVAGVYDWNAVATFFLNFTALVPLALILGDITEDFALRCGPVTGGLINATFGNVVEVVLSLTALKKGLYKVVATSLLGSILSNLLLVLGCCFLFGGLRHKVQSFNAMSNRACSSLLFLASIGVAIPTCAAHIIKDPDRQPDFILSVSHVSAVVLLFSYLCYLIFQLKTHSQLFDGSSDDVLEEPVLSTTTAMSCLAIISAAVAVHSEYLTSSIEAVSAQTGLGQAFLGMIVLPIAGNACEHLTAVVVAMKNKMDLAVGIAIGSSLQIALLAIPLAVIVSWIGGGTFSLNVDYFSVLAMVLSVSHANFVTSDASSTWLAGVSLIGVYILTAVTYLYR